MSQTLVQTKLSYMEDSYKFEDTARVLAVETLDNGKLAILLDQTIFYPQGGGQPFDTGLIKGTKGTFQVTEVRFDQGVVFHIGHWQDGSFDCDDQVRLYVDEERRRLHCRIHSAGHLLDVAVRNVGLSLIPTKGYHFADSPYVEYEGEIPADRREALKGEIEVAANQLITEATPVLVELATREELSRLCDFVPDYIPKDKPARVVTIGSVGTPCGGTHVKNTAEIGAITVSKIKVKGTTIRVSYTIN